MVFYDCCATRKIYINYIFSVDIYITHIIVIIEVYNLYWRLCKRDQLVSFVKYFSHVCCILYECCQQTVNVL